MRTLSAWTLAIALLAGGCDVNYSFSGGSVPAGAKTVSIGLFDARAPLCTPQSAQTLTETVRDLLQAQTPLNLVRTEGDIQYEGAVIAYDVQPVAIQANESAALKFGSSAAAIFPTLRWTNISPGSRSTISVAGTRLSEHPIQKY